MARRDDQPSLRTLRLLGSRWTLPFLEYLDEAGEARWSEVRTALGAPDRSLSDRARQLGEAGLIKRRVEHDSGQVQVQVHYSLSAKGSQVLRQTKQLRETIDDP